MRGIVRAVAAFPFLLQGCALLSVEREPAQRPGWLSAVRGRPGVVIGAPHGSSDASADRISVELARRTGFGLVVATDEPDREYESRVREVSKGPLRLYVEIHGNSRRESAGRIEVATVGVSRTDAWRLKTLFEMIRDAHLRNRLERLRLDVRVEPLDPISWTASGAKRVGILRISERAIHIELPRAARVEGREVYTEILAEFLKESSRLLLAKEQ